MEIKWVADIVVDKDNSNMVLAVVYHEWANEKLYFGEPTRMEARNYNNRLRAARICVADCLPINQECIATNVYNSLAEVMQYVNDNYKDKFCKGLD